MKKKEQETERAVETTRLGSAVLAARRPFRSVLFSGTLRDASDGLSSGRKLVD
jgi:hypothetical protein